MQIRPAAASTDFPPVRPLAGGTVVGSFVLHALECRDDFGLRYRGTVGRSAESVTIEEYAPAGITQRLENGALHPRSPDHAMLWAEGLHAFVSESERFSRFGFASLQPLGPLLQARGTGYRIRGATHGRTLAEIRAAMIKPPSEIWLRWLLAPLLTGLQALHEAGGLHGNVTPHSILLTPDGSPLLVDPAAVRLAIGARLPLPPEWPWPPFVAPEVTTRQARLAVGTWSDVYSLAAVVRFCISGSVPIGRGLTNIAALPSSEGWSMGFVDAIERALASDPRERPQDMLNLRRALHAPPIRVPTSPVQGSSIRRMTSLPSVPAWPSSRYEASPAPSRPIPADSSMSGPANARAAPSVDPLRDERPRRSSTLVRAGVRSRPLPARRWPMGLLGAAVGATLMLLAFQGPSRVGSVLPTLAGWGSTSSLPVQAERPPTVQAVRLGGPVRLPDANSEAIAIPAATPLVSPVAPDPGQTSAARDTEPPKPVAKPAGVADKPSDLCAPRRNFSLYTCMTTQCESPRFIRHAECIRLRDTGDWP